jgi:hypothetical protein
LIEELREEEMELIALKEIELIEELNEELKTLKT